MELRLARLVAGTVGGVPRARDRAGAVGAAGVRADLTRHPLPPEYLRPVGRAGRSVMAVAGWQVPRSGELWAVASILLGAAVAAILGVFAVYHTPSQAVPTLGFETVTAMKVWLGATAGALALVQLA